MIFLQKRIRRIIACERGQGMTEYALVLLFVLLMLAALNSSSLRQSALNIYAKVGRALSGEVATYADAVEHYGSVPNVELQQVENTSRVSMDKEAITNLASRFLGLTRDQVADLLSNTGERGAVKSALSNPYDENSPKGLGQGVLLFDYYIENVGEGENQTVQTRFDKSKAAPEDILNWMQGDYTTSSSHSTTMISNSRYLFSDDTIDSSGIVSGSMAETGTYALCVRTTMTFNGEGETADSVRLWVTRNKQKDGSSTWLRYPCDDLTVTVTK